MLAAEQRLRQAGDFSAAIRSGGRASRGGLVIHLYPARTDGGARAGFVVPRAVGPAVTRNKVRRRLRHLLRERLTALPAGTDVVVRVLPGAADASYEVLGVDLDAALAAAQRRHSRGPDRQKGEVIHVSTPGEAHERHEHPVVRGDVPPATSVGGRVLSWPIIAYRRWISPALPPRCRFYPSCSEYALTAIAIHGPVRGVGLGIWRLLRCHPFNPGGIDHVPPRRVSRRRRDRSMTSWAG